MMAVLNGTIQALVAARAKPKIRLVSVQRNRGVTVRLPVNVVIRLQPAKTQHLFRVFRTERESFLDAG